MKAYKEMSKEELLNLKCDLENAYKEFKGQGLSLDMSRGKPCAAQMDLAMGMMDVFHSRADLTSEDGIDCRNYGVLDGLPEAKRLMASMMNCKAERMIIYGNSRLAIMYDFIGRSMTHGVMGNIPWAKLEKKVKFLCPSPGYDRHFAISDYYGIENIPVPMTPTGPDMDIVEKMVAEDEMIKGIWCVPKYSNPQGISYSDETVRRFARLKPAAPDFRIYWDHAYCIHHLYEEPEKQDEILELISECEKAGNPDLAYKFVSTSKVSFPGSGVSAMSTSPANLEVIKKQLSIQTISFDKINQLRHVRYFPDINAMKAHMMKHAAILRPKFELTCDILDEELGGLGIGEWNRPRGGYFVSFEAMDGCAKAIVAKAKEAGVIMTEAGATFPYKKDPKDSNIRIAPSFPELDELEKAMKLFTLCVKLVSVDKLLENM